MYQVLLTAPSGHLVIWAALAEQLAPTSVLQWQHHHANLNQLRHIPLVQDSWPVVTARSSLLYTRIASNITL
jgi:hypothetical protein